VNQEEVCSRFKLWKARYLQGCRGNFGDWARGDFQNQNKSAKVVLVSQYNFEAGSIWLRKVEKIDIH
jgi:hypothetical protein